MFYFIYLFHIGKIVHYIVDHNFVQRVLAHQEEQALLKAYIAEWRKFFTQCNYLPTPFRKLETCLAGKTSSSTQKRNQPDDIVRKVTEV